MVLTHNGIKLIDVGEIFCNYSIFRKSVKKSPSGYYSSTIKHHIGTSIECSFQLLVSKHYDTMV